MISQDNDWHLDKRVPLGFLLAIIAQTATFVYVGTQWKSDIDHRLGSLEKSDDSKALQGNRLIILEQQYGFITSTLQRIEDKIDQKVNK